MYTTIILSRSERIIGLLQTPYDYAGKYDKEETTKTTNCTIRRKVQNNGREEIVKEYFSPSMNLQNELENIPLQEVLMFRCHKCHTREDKALINRKKERCINIYSDLLPETERKREKQAVVLGKTTRCFIENDTLFLVKQAVV